MSNPTPEQLSIIKALAETIKPKRAPILKTPADYGMEFEDVFFRRSMVFHSKPG